MTGEELWQREKHDAVQRTQNIKRAHTKTAWFERGWFSIAAVTSLATLIILHNYGGESSTCDWLAGLINDYFHIILEVDRSALLGFEPSTCVILFVYLAMTALFVFKIILSGALSIKIYQIVFVATFAHMVLGFPSNYMFILVNILLGVMAIYLYPRPQPGDTPQEMLETLKNVLDAADPSLYRICQDGEMDGAVAMPSVWVDRYSE